MPKPKLREIVQNAIDELQKKKQMDKDAGALIASLEEGLVKAITPALEKAVGSMQEGMAKNMKGMTMAAPKIDMPAMELDMSSVGEAIKSAISDSFKGIKINVPEVKLPTINVPEMKMPAINIPPMTIQEVSLKGVSSKNPIPVLLHGTDGKPILNFGSNGGGSKSNFLAIKNILTANGDSILDDVNDAMRTRIVASDVSFTTTQASDFVQSTNAIQIGGNTIAVDSGVTGVGVQRIVHVTDVGMSVNVTNFTASVAVSMQTDDGDSCMDETNDALRVNVVAGSTAGTQYTEGDDPTDGTGVGNLMMAEDEDFMRALQVGSGRDSLALRVVHATNVAMSVEIASQPFTLDIKQASGFVNSVNIAQQDVALETRQISGSSDSVNVISSVPLDIRQVSGLSFSVEATGNIAHDSVDSGNPIKIGGIAKTTQFTAVSSADRVNAVFDTAGRQVMRVHQVRDLVRTAYATLSTNSLTTLLTGVSARFHDLVWLKFSNTSSGAVTVDLYDGSTIVDTYEIPANGVTGISMTTPYPQAALAQTWSVDYNDSDLSNTTVYVSALFSEEI